MIGILVAAHQDLGQALLRAAAGILGPLEAAEAITLSYEEAPTEAQGRVAAAVGRLAADGEVLILTDMFGGTPANLCLALLEPGRVEVLTGVNLPMVLKAATARRELALPALATLLREYGGKNIVLASELLRGKPPGGG